jgi:hypothetical protein
MNWSAETQKGLENSRALLIGCWREAARRLRAGEPLSSAVAAVLLEQAAELLESGERLRRLTAMTKE